MKPSGVYASDATLKLVADYFTGHDVVHHSIGLQMHSPLTYACAQRFFKARSALGITGHMNAAEALAVLKKRSKK